MRSAVSVAIGLSLVACSTLERDPQCPLGPYETNLGRLRDAPVEPNASVADRHKTNRAVPIEIAQIRSGGYSHFVGSYVNDGLITWYGFDASRRAFVAVLGRAGPRLTRVPNPAHLLP